jgi:prephenate dehydrogenase
MAHIGKLVVCGVGLIGGSFALALRRAGAVERIVGIGRRREVLERACALGVIDEIAEGWADALDGADLVLLAAPVGQTDAILAAMAPHLRPGTIVTDAGSTKRDVVAALRTIWVARSPTWCRRTRSPAPRRAGSRPPSPSSTWAARWC